MLEREAVTNRSTTSRGLLALALVAACHISAPRIDGSTDVHTSEGSQANVDPRIAQLDMEAVLAGDCGFGASACRLRFESRPTGPFTWIVEVRLRERPRQRAAIVSATGAGDNDPAYELGVDDRQQLYFQSAQGSAATPPVPVVVPLRTLQQLRLRETFEIAVVVSPGNSTTLYLNGAQVHRRQAQDAFEEAADTLPPAGQDPAHGDSAVVAVGRVRMFDRALAGADVAAIASAHGRRSSPPSLPAIRAITRGPRFHWFGYYDKRQFDPSDRYALGMAVDFENREVTSDDTVEIGMVDLASDDTWTALGKSRAWNWQQGCMLQWIPGSKDEVIWNDREGEGKQERFVARILDVTTGKQRTIPHPIYTITPDGKTALTINFTRLHRARPTYGYPSPPERQQDTIAPAQDGISRVDLERGTSTLIVSLAEVVEFGRTGQQSSAEHYVEMLQINPAGTRLLFYERWHGQRTRAFTVDLDGGDLFLLADEGELSHVNWLDDQHLVIFAPRHDGYAIFEDGHGYAETLLHSPRDGHHSFLRRGEWMLSDTYPDGSRLQHPFLYHEPSDELFALAHLLSPPRYSGGYRSDTHPRLSHDARRVVIDSTHGPHGPGRQMYVIDIGEILDSIPEHGGLMRPLK